MRVAFVVPRYGEDIVGGAEYYTRMVAEHLKGEHAIEVLTTCARNYLTWKNEYEPGIELVNGVIVRRFKTDRERVLSRHTEAEQKVFYNAHGRDDELRWIDEQGPYSLDLINYIKTEKNNYDRFIFFTFRYFLSYYGIMEAGAKSLIAPFAENDPALDLSTTREIFNKIGGVIYSTPEERRLILSKVNFKEDEKFWDLIGFGIERPAGCDNGNKSEKGDYIMYLGRIDGSKGCYTLFEYYQRAAGELRTMPDLVLAGFQGIDVPKHDKIKNIGFVSEEQKFPMLKNSKFLIMPSPYESLSIVTLEAMACGTPVLVNGECAVLKGHCKRSNAGLWYNDFDEFMECSKLLASNDELRDKMGKNGKKYVSENYNWDGLKRKYSNLLEKIVRV
jgi:glycosyltransferase involved in cell wall biosynthesis